MKRVISIIFVFVFLLSSCKSSPAPNEKKESSENIIGVWLNYNEIAELVNKSSNYNEFKSNIQNIILKFKNYSVNTIFLHTRAFDDSFYNSAQFPVSKYCADSNGKLKFDVLEAFLDIAHKENMKIHAWINPYRISFDSDITKLPKDFLPYKWYNEDSQNQRLVICEKGIYFNPASVEAQKHIINGIKEIIDNYNVDGIHFDDYFYPDTSPEIDSSYYNEYVENGGYLSLGNYRRQCVNALISSVYSVIKEKNKTIIFSISPSGSIENNINQHFADVKLWASTSGYVDYLIPQIYYGFNNQKYPFENTVMEWEKIVSEDIGLIIGLPLYKIGEVDKFAGQGKNEWIDNNDIISRQIKYIKNNKEIKGYSLYSGSMLYSENLSEHNITELNNIKNTKS